MFDAHHINRRYSRKIQRNGQIIRSRLQNPLYTIDHNLVTMYRDFLLRNPQYLNQPINQGVLQSNLPSPVTHPLTSRHFSSPRNDIHPPQPWSVLLPTSPTPTQYTFHELTAFDVDTFSTLSDIDSYFVSSPMIITYSSSSTNFANRLFFVETPYYYCFSVVHLQSIVPGQRGVTARAALPKVAVPEGSTLDQLDCYYIDFGTPVSQPIISIFSRPYSSYPEPLLLCELITPFVSVQGSDPRPAIEYIPFTCLSKEGFT